DRGGLLGRDRSHRRPARLGMVSHADGSSVRPRRHPSSTGVEVKRIVRLTVNGVDRDVMVEPHHTLLDVLRRDFELMSVREGCGVGMCGACTVLADGKPVSSCLTLAALAHGKTLVTLEGLMEGTELHPIQQAYLDNAGFQCSFCTPGFILGTKALLE